MRKALLFSVALLVLSAATTSLMGQRSSRAVAKTMTTPQAVFAGVEAFSDGRSVFVRWQMSVEQNNIGFYVYRRARGTGFELLAPERIVPGSKIRQGSEPAYGTEYSFVDVSGNYRASYLVQSVLADGQVVSSGYVLPQYVYDLRAVAGDALNTAPSTRKMPSIESAAKQLDKELAAEVASYAADADDATHEFVISQPGVRISIKREGWYRVTRAELQAGGFDVNSNPGNWQLYVEGVQQAISVGPNADYIEFYGKGADTVETDLKVYYLIVGSAAGRRVTQKTLRPGQSTVISRGYDQTAVRKERTNYIDELLNGDAENYWGRAIGAGLPTTYNFTLTGIDTSSPTATLRVNFQGYSNTSHSIELFLNGQALAPTTGEQVFPYSKLYTIPISMLTEGANSLQMRSAGPSGDFNLFDSLSVSYNRRYLAEQNRVGFFTQNLKAAQLEGFTTADVRIFDITDVNNPVQATNYTVEPNGATFGVFLPAGRGRVYYAVSGDGLLQAEAVTPNDPALLRVPGTQADLVIIAYKDYLAQAETWANYRRGQGFTVKVVEVTEIYDEFNYGSLSSASIRSFLQYSVLNWQTPPRYVLILGEACYDSRNYEGTGYWNQVPTRLVDSVFSTTASDEWLGDFDGDGLSQLAIGRIASRNSTGISTVFNKVVTFEALPGNQLDRGALFAYDFNDSQNDFAAMTTQLRGQLPVTAPTTSVFRGDPNAATSLITQMNTGKLIVNYSGHGTTGTWGGSPVFFNIFSVPSLTNASSPSIYTMLTCLNGYFHNITNESFAEALTKAQNGGAVAAWASSGLTASSQQLLMGNRFYNQVGAGNIQRLGDLIKDAKSVVPGGSSVRFSWALIGDPMLKVR